MTCFSIAFCHFLYRTYRPGPKLFAVVEICSPLTLQLKYILCALVNHLSEQIRSLLIIFLNILSITPPGNGNVGVGPRKPSRIRF